MGFKNDFYIGECEGMETKEHKLIHMYVLIMQVERFWGSFLCVRTGERSHSFMITGSQTTHTKQLP